MIGGPKYNAKKRNTIQFAPVLYSNFFSSLTSDNRDNWAAAFKILMNNNQNKSSVDEIEKSLFLMALDEDMSQVPAYDNMSRSALQSLHGLESTENRWNDKAMQVQT